MGLGDGGMDFFQNGMCLLELKKDLKQFSFSFTWNTHKLTTTAFTCTFQLPSLQQRPSLVDLFTDADEDRSFLVATWRLDMKKGSKNPGFVNIKEVLTDQEFYLI